MKPDCKYFEKCSVHNCPKLHDSRLVTVPEDTETVCRNTAYIEKTVLKTTVITDDFDGIKREATEVVSRHKKEIK